MAGSFNKVILLGNLTRDPELRYTPKGTAVTDISLAINDMRSKSAEQQRTTYVDVTFWDRSAEIICEYMRKGSSILVEGRLQTDSWEDRETGKRVYKLKVIAQNFQFTGSRSDNPGSSSMTTNRNSGGGNYENYNNNRGSNSPRKSSDNQFDGGSYQPGGNNQYGDFDNGDFGGGNDDDIPF